MTAPVSDNRLGDEVSPYLLQHRDNPVNWRPWGPAALAEARAAGKPILLSVGYAACHWCHVMAHESFEDAEVAAVMNRLYVNIKVDREERPDIDQIYMNALHALGEQGGWPLTMFLTPDGDPVWGGTYFPREPRWGRPGFIQVLEAIARLFADEPERIEASRASLIERLNAGAAAAAPLGRDLLDQAADMLYGLIDLVDGGTRGAPKFPQAALFELLWRAGKRTGDARFLDAVLLTLERICQGGIYDHVGGGFSRYSTDDRWLAPHFEKMLYDNAQLIELLGLAHAATGAQLFRRRIDETIAFLRRELLTPAGGFAASLDADSEGEEGRFYVWSLAEIEAELGADAGLFCRTYGVTAAGNWEGHVILNRSHAPELGDAAAEDHLAALRARLLAKRAQRVRPATDDKILADWNGLAIAAIARVALQFDRPDWLALATGAYRCVADSMSVAGRLGHSARAGRLTLPGLATDYAAMIKAALALFEATRAHHYLTDAETWAALVERHYLDAEHGGYFLTADDAEALILRPKTGLDEATPNPNAVMAANLTRLWRLTGRDPYRASADRTLAAFSGEIRRNVFGTAALLNALDLRLEPIDLIVVAPAGADAGPLIAAALGSADPRLIVSVSESTAALPADHPAHGKPALGNRPTAYVCRGQTCSLPMGDPAELARHLGFPATAPGG